MNSGYREENIYLKNDNKIGPDALEAIKDAIASNNAVGTIAGYYDESLTILSVSDYLLDNLDYDLEGFNKVAQGSLKNICCGKNVIGQKEKNFRKFKEI